MTSLEALSRRELQALAKRHGLRANKKTCELISELKKIKHDANEPNAEESAAAEPVPATGTERMEPATSESTWEERAIDLPTLEQSSIVAPISDADESALEESPSDSRHEDDMAVDQPTAMAEDADPAARAIHEAPSSQSKSARAPAQPSSQPRSARSARPWKVTPFVPLKSEKPLTRLQPFAAAEPGSASLSDRGVSSLKSIEAASRKRLEDSRREEASEARKAAAATRRELISTKFKAENAATVPVINGKPTLAAWDIAAAAEANGPLHATSGASKNTAAVPPRQTFKAATTALAPKAAERKRAGRKVEEAAKRRAAVQMARAK